MCIAMPHLAATRRSGFVTSPGKQSAHHAALVESGRSDRRVSLATDLERPSYNNRRSVTARAPTGRSEPPSRMPAAESGAIAPQGAARAQASSLPPTRCQPARPTVCPVFPNFARADRPQR